MKPKTNILINIISGIPPKMLWGFITTIVLGIGSFVWMNASLPKDKKANEVNSAVNRSLLAKDSIKSIELDRMKMKIDVMAKTQDDLMETTNDGFDKLNSRLDQLFIVIQRQRVSFYYKDSLKNYCKK